MRFDGKFASAVKVAAGSLAFAAGFTYFLDPADIIPGGVTGLAMIANRLTGIPVGTASVLLNLPVFWAAWRFVGRDFFKSSLVGAVLSGALIDVLSLTEARMAADTLLCAIFGGALSGIGMGLVFSAGASTGGVDIIVRILRKKYSHLGAGKLMMAVDLAVVAAGAAVFRSAESALYAVIAVYVMSELTDAVLYGISHSVMCLIISDRFEDINSRIVEQLGRGVTLLSGRGGYSGREKTVLMCVIGGHQLTELKHLVGDTDPEAFIVISEAGEVLGQGFMEGTV